jgi:hypothetical protein
MFWSSIEINVGILCACMPAVKGFLAKLFPTVFGSSYGTKKASVFSGPNTGGYMASSKASRGRRINDGDDGVGRAGDSVIMKTMQFKVHVEGDDESTNDLLAGVQKVGTSSPSGMGSHAGRAPSTSGTTN